MTGTMIFFPFVIECSVLSFTMAVAIPTLYAIKPRIEEVSKGNKHLEDLRIHPLKTRFYVKVKELNPEYTLVMKHPVNEKQSAIQSKKNNRRIIKIRYIFSI